MITVIDLSSDDETPIQKGISAVVTPTTTTTTTTTQKQRNQQRSGQSCQTTSPKSKGTQNNNNTCTKFFDGKQIEFIDHVVMIWLNRVRSGYKNLEMPDNILKAKAKEAATVLDSVCKFSANGWLTGFQQKLKKMREEKQTIDTGNSNVFRIEEIIKEEKPKFFKNYVSNNSSNANSIDGKSVEEENLAKRLREIEDNQQKQLSKMLEDQKEHLEKVKEAQRKQLEQIKEAQKQRDDNLRKQQEMNIRISESQKSQTNSKAVVPPASATKLRFGVLRKPEDMQKAGAIGPGSHRPLTAAENVTLFEVIDVDDVLDEPIQSYEEALDCLALVENYFLSTRNLKAVMFINQIESFLKNQISS